MRHRVRHRPCPGYMRQGSGNRKAGRFSLDEFLQRLEVRQSAGGRVGIWHGPQPIGHILNRKLKQGQAEAVNGKVHLHLRDSQLCAEREQIEAILEIGVYLVQDQRLVDVPPPTRDLQERNLAIRHAKIDALDW